MQPNAVLCAYRVELRMDEENMPHTSSTFLHTFGNCKSRWASFLHATGHRMPRKGYVFYLLHIAQGATSAKEGPKAMHLAQAKISGHLYQA